MRPVDRVEKLPDAVKPKLENVLRDASLQFSGGPCKGPDGFDGVMISACSKAHVGYYPDKQKWHLVKGGDGKVLYGIGWELSDPPAPADLLRPKPIDGHTVKLNDGNEWIIPAVHWYRPTLPRGCRVNSSGELELSIMPGYDELTKQAEKWFDIYYQRKPFVIADYFRYVWDLLAVNYRLSWDECSMDVLNLINENSRMVTAVVEASLGIPAIAAEEEAKKKEIGTLQGS